MDAFLFALAIFFTPTDAKKPDGETFKVPLAYSMYAWELAQQYDNVSAVDVVTIVVGEHGWRYPYDPGSTEYERVVIYEEIDGLRTPVRVEKRPANVGLMQLGRFYLKRYNKAHPQDKHSLEDLYDWRVNMQVGVYNIHKSKKGHQSGRRKVCRKGNHFWTAHWTCASAIRNHPGCQARKKLHKRLSAWEDNTVLQLAEYSWFQRIWAEEPEEIDMAQ